MDPQDRSELLPVLEVGYAGFSRLIKPLSEPLCSYISGPFSRKNNMLPKINGDAKIPELLMCF